MEKIITVKEEYTSLDSLLTYLKATSSYECSKEYDIWEQRTGANGQMEQCLVLKKNTLHGLKVYFPQRNSLKMTYIIPNKVMNAYFGKSAKARKSILELITEKIKLSILAPAQKKAFLELESQFKGTLA